MLTVGITTEKKHVVNAIASVKLKFHIQGHKDNTCFIQPADNILKKIKPFTIHMQFNFSLLTSFNSLDI